MALSKLNLSDLPLEIVEKIVKVTNLPSRLSLRKVSRVFRFLVDKQAPKHQSIEISINEKFIKLVLEGYPIWYRTAKNGTCLVGTKPRILENDPMEVLFDDLKTFMKTSEFEILKLEFSDMTSYDQFVRLLPERIPFKIAVKKVFISTQNGQFASPILPWFKDDVIREIEKNHFGGYGSLRHCRSLYIRDAPDEEFRYLAVFEDVVKKEEDIDMDMEDVEQKF